MKAQPLQFINRPGTEGEVQNNNKELNFSINSKNKHNLQEYFIQKYANVPHSP